MINNLVRRASRMHTLRHGNCCNTCGCFFALALACLQPMRCHLTSDPRGLDGLNVDNLLITRPVLWIPVTDPPMLAVQNYPPILAVDSPFAFGTVSHRLARAMLATKYQASIRRSMTFSFLASLVFVWMLSQSKTRLYTK